MNKTRNIWTFLFFVFILFSCTENKNKNDDPNKVERSESIHKLLVDYKKDEYKISMGENYQSSYKTIDWVWAALNDSDDKVDSTGKDAYLFIGEPHIKYHEETCLPTLHIETDRNIITSFSCSILFTLIDTSENEKKVFLKILSKDIQQLRNMDIVKSLVESGVYVKTTQNYIETFILEKAKGYGYDKFEYTVKPI